jgi:hypothetical protein
MQCAFSILLVLVTGVATNFEVSTKYYPFLCYTLMIVPIIQEAYYVTRK